MNFYKLISTAPDIQKADGSLLGSIPLRAKQYCEALSAASRLGWYVYPPISFSLLWTGDEVAIQLQDTEEWISLDRFFLEDFVSDYLNYAPDSCKDFYPSFLDLFSEGDIVQIWSGYAISGSTGWCHHVRAPINIRSNRHYDIYEAIVDSSWYCSPLLINIKLRSQNTPIYFPKHQPLFQVIPFPVAMLNATTHPKGIIINPDNLEFSFWDQWKETFERRNKGQKGGYARIQRLKNETY